MSGTVANILYVEDDETLSYVTIDNLKLKGYEITHCTTGKEAIKSFEEEGEFDLCILDIMLPEMDGYDVAEFIRTRDAEIPILFLSAKSLDEDRIHGLKIGGDDYITKPFNIDELALRIQVFLKRRKVRSVPEAPVRIGQYRFDYEQLALSCDGQTHALTQKEADLLNHFAENRNRILKRGDILKQVWGKDDYFLGRSLDVFVSRLRKYLKDDEHIAIENIHGVGFRLRC